MINFLIGKIAFVYLALLPESGSNPEFHLPYAKTGWWNILYVYLVGLLNIRDTSGLLSALYATLITVPILCQPHCLIQVDVTKGVVMIINLPNQHTNFSKN